MESEVSVSNCGAAACCFGTMLRVGEPVELEGGLKGYPADLVLLSGKEMYREDFGGRFIIDLSSLILEKRDYIGDYNHNPDEVIGRGTLSVTDRGLTGACFVIPFKEGDRASEIVARSRAGTPYEASPTINDDTADEELLPAGKRAEVNGEEITGPIHIYRNVPIRGWSVCPFGTDRQTNFQVLKSLEKGEKQMAKKQLKKLNEELPPEETPDKTPPAEGSDKYTAYPDLEKMIEEFGLEKGVEYYRLGLTIEEAEKIDYQELKAARSKLSEPEEPEGEPEPDPEPPEETKELKAAVKQLLDMEFKALKATVETLNTAVGRLSAAVQSGGEHPVSGSQPGPVTQKGIKLTAAEAYAMKKLKSMQRKDAAPR
jgi:hypothetical protein